MNEQRIREITRLASTRLPSTGPVPNAPDLLRQVNQALKDTNGLSRIGYWGTIIKLLLELRREAQETIRWADTQLLPGETERGDHDLR